MVNFKNIKSELDGKNEWDRSLAISKVDKALNEGKNIKGVFDLFPGLLFEVSDGVDEFNVKGVIIKYLNKKDDDSLKRSTYKQLEDRLAKWKENKSTMKIENKRKLIDDIKRLTSPL
ncbi:MAG: hypothetical protein GF329_04310 [Candidatus Lokiarchaeota archaeon]|nr:hypothetical protein [Candidatus Lokiarchaeota archaeon]